MGCCICMFTVENTVENRTLHEIITCVKARSNEDES